MDTQIDQPVEWIIISPAYQGLLLCMSVLFSKFALGNKEVDATFLNKYASI